MKNERIHKLSIVSVVGQYVCLRATGREYKGLCPFHAEKTPSFSVNEDKGVFHCFGCGESGDVITFIRKVEGLSFKEAVSRLGIASGHIPTPQKNTVNRRAAEKLVAWMNRQHILVGVRLRKLSQQIPIAQEIPNNELVESLSREWELLSGLHEDLQRPEYAAELWEARDMIEALTVDIEPEPLPVFPAMTDSYREYLRALC